MIKKYDREEWIDNGIATKLKEIGTGRNAAGIVK